MLALFFSVLVILQYLLISVTTCQLSLGFWGFCGSKPSHLSFQCLIRMCFPALQTSLLHRAQLSLILKLCIAVFSLNDSTLSFLNSLHVTSLKHISNFYWLLKYRFLTLICCFPKANFRSFTELPRHITAVNKRQQTRILRMIQITLSLKYRQMSLSKLTIWQGLNVLRVDSIIKLQPQIDSIQLKSMLSYKHSYF